MSTIGATRAGGHSAAEGARAAEAAENEASMAEIKMKWGKRKNDIIKGNI